MRTGRRARRRGISWVRQVYHQRSAEASRICCRACDTQCKVDELSPVTQLLKKARRRAMVDLVLDQLALAISIAMGGAILLMLTGTSLLDCYWISLLAVE